MRKMIDKETFIDDYIDACETGTPMEIVYWVGPDQDSLQKIECSWNPTDIEETYKKMIAEATSIYVSKYPNGVNYEDIEWEYDKDDVFYAHQDSLREAGLKWYKEYIMNFGKGD